MSESECPICGNGYNKLLSGTVGDGQPLDVSEYAKICYEYQDDGSVCGYIHKTTTKNQPKEWHPIMKELYSVNELHKVVETEVAKARIDDAVINLKSALEAVE